MSKLAEPKFEPLMLTGAQLNARDRKQEWLVTHVLVRGQPVVVGGPQKTLKTGLVIDLTVSLGSGTPFLGRFEVPKPVRVWLMSGESGEDTIWRNALEVCKARGIEIESPDAIWDFCLPQLSRPSHVEELRKLIKDHDVEVVIIDPLYLCLLAGQGGKSAQASNVFDMGPLLLNVAQACLSVGCTPILVHHTVKSSGNKREPVDLVDLAFSGTGEFARQWILLNRRSDFIPDTGFHQLWITMGGSAGHHGRWAVDVYEGVLQADFTGRKWDVKVLTGAQEKERKENQKLEARVQQNQTDEAEVLKVVEDLDPARGGIGRERVRALVPLSERRFDKAVARLIHKGALEHVEVLTVIGNGAKRKATGLRRIK
jgi:hypothetical protein